MSFHLCHTFLFFYATPVSRWNNGTHSPIHPPPIRLYDPMIRWKECGVWYYNYYRFDGCLHFDRPHDCGWCVMDDRIGYLLNSHDTHKISNDWWCPRNKIREPKRKDRECFRIKLDLLLRSLLQQRNAWSMMASRVWSALALSYWTIKDVVSFRILKLWGILYAKKSFHLLPQRLWCKFVSCYLICMYLLCMQLKIINKNVNNKNSWSLNNLNPQKLILLFCPIFLDTVSVQ